LGTLEGFCSSNLQSLVSLFEDLIFLLNELDSKPSEISSEESKPEYKIYLEKIQKLLKGLPQKEFNEKRVAVFL